MCKFVESRSNSEKKSVEYVVFHYMNKTVLGKNIPERTTIEDNLNDFDKLSTKERFYFGENEYFGNNIPIDRFYSYEEKKENIVMKKMKVKSNKRYEIVNRGENSSVQMRVEYVLIRKLWKPSGEELMLLQKYHQCSVCQSSYLNHLSYFLFSFIMYLLFLILEVDLTLPLSLHL